MTDKEFLEKITDVERKMFSLYKKLLFRDERVLEIGTGWGLFSRFCMMLGITDLTTIDKIPDPRHFSENVHGYENNIHRIVGDSKEVLKKLKDFDYDIVMIDGDHGYEGFKADFIEAVRLVKSYGMIIVDDVWHPKNFQNDYGILKALSELCMHFDFEITIYPFGHGIAVINIKK
jgi:predicted O-methyltransferase YrrM